MMAFFVQVLDKTPSFRSPRSEERASPPSYSWTSLWGFSRPEKGFLPQDLWEFAGVPFSLPDTQLPCACALPLPSPASALPHHV